MSDANKDDRYLCDHHGDVTSQTMTFSYWGKADAIFCLRCVQQFLDAKIGQVTVAPKREPACGLFLDMGRDFDTHVSETEPAPEREP